MKIARLVLTAMFLAGLFSVVKAHPTRICGDYTKVARNLTEKSGEARISVGTFGGAARMEMWAKQSGPRIKRTWTVLIIFPNNTACLDLGGTGFNPNPINSEGSL